MRTRKVFRHTALASILLGVFGTAHALYELEELEEYVTPESSISAGLGYWTKDRPRLGAYDAMNEGGLYGLLDVSLNRRDNETGEWLRLEARNLGLDNRSLSGEYSQQGNYGLKLTYRRMTRDDPLSFYTRQVPGSVQWINPVSRPADDPSSWYMLRLGTQREVLGLEVTKTLMRGLNFDAKFTNEEKTGWRNWSRASAVSFVAEPIDTTTRQLDAVLTYSTEKWQLSGGYYGSWFSNSYKYVAVATDENSTPDYLSLPLDNQAHQFHLEGGYNFTPATRGTFKLAYNRATQNESLFQDPNNSVTIAPDSLDARVDTKTAQLGIVSRPTKKLSLLAKLHYRDVNNKTYPYMVYSNGSDCETSANNCSFNRPLSTETWTGQFEAKYRLSGGYRITAALTEKRQNRALSGPDYATYLMVPERTGVDETTTKLQLSKGFSETITGALSWVRSDRDGSGFSWSTVQQSVDTGSGTAQTNPVNYINPINIADRVRNKLRLSVDWNALDTLALQFVGEIGRDNYDHSADRPAGLRDGDMNLFSVDATWTPTDTWQFNVWYSFDSNKANQYNYRYTSTDPLNTTGLQEETRSVLSDKGHSLGMGVRAELTPKIDMGADVQWMRSNSRYDQHREQSQEFDLDDIVNRQLRLGMFVSYAFSKQSKVRLDLIHERWKSDDWTWLFADGSSFIYGNSDGTTVFNKPRQVSSFIGVRYIYSFQ